MNDIWALQIENTAFCNRKCSWCPQSVLKFTPDQRMSWETLETIVKNLKELGYTGRIHPYGNGEPLTDPDFIDRVRYIRRQMPRCYIYIATNGDLIGKPHSFKDIIDAGCHEIQCNHYDDKKFYLMDDSPPEVKHLTLGMLRTTFYNRGGNVEITNVNIQQKCDLTTTKLFFNYLGDLLLCCSDWRYQYPIGNINKQSLQEMLSSALMKKYREDYPLCHTCNMISHKENLWKVTA